jgi:hypothetical protein
MSPSMRERLIDRLQVALPLVQRLQVTAQKNHADAATATAALVELIEILREPMPLYDHPGERTVRDLGLAITRRGLTISECAHLTSIPEPRLRHLIGGTEPTTDERTALLAALPEWQPTREG